MPLCWHSPPHQLAWEHTASMIARNLMFLLLLVVGGLGGLYLSKPELWNQAPAKTAQQSVLPPVTPMPEPALALAKAEPTPESIIIAPPTTEPSQAPELSITELVQSALHTSTSAAACLQPSNTTVSAKATPTVYTWVDANGQRHFGDRQPLQAKAEHYQVELGKRMDFFDLHLDYRGQQVVPYVQQKLGPQVTQIYEVLADLVGVQRLRKVQLQLVVFPEQQPYLQYALATTGIDHSDAGGYFFPARNEAVTFVHNTEAETLTVANHEATHVIALGMMGSIPLWLNEGMADYFSQLTVTGLYAEVGLAQDRLQYLLASQAGGQRLLLTQLFALTDASWGKDDVALHYSMAWSLVYFLMSTPDGKAALADTLQTLVDNYCQGMDAATELTNRYPGGITALQGQWLKWLRQAQAAKAHVY